MRQFVNLSFFYYVLKLFIDYEYDAISRFRSQGKILREKLITEHDTTYLLVCLVEQNTKNLMNTLMM